ncbi:hypothetical protein [Flaviaesturariibacter amylovorans]|uniref:Uncharacterized protein n=1 Tax=Flaviaesturariibacter amylovorans TaxID=1084520 RepID=A0ABP8HRE1_9BACT
MKFAGYWATLPKNTIDVADCSNKELLAKSNIINSAFDFLLSKLDTLEREDYSAIDSLLAETIGFAYEVAYCRAADTNSQNHAFKLLERARSTANRIDKSQLSKAKIIGILEMLSQYDLEDQKRRDIEQELISYQS